MQRDVIIAFVIGAAVAITIIGIITLEFESRWSDKGRLRFIICCAGIVIGTHIALFITMSIGICMIAIFTISGIVSPYYGRLRRASVVRELVEVSAFALWMSIIVVSGIAKCIQVAVAAIILLLAHAFYAWHLLQPTQLPAESELIQEHIIPSRDALWSNRGSALLTSIAGLCALALSLCIVMQLAVFTKDVQRTAWQRFIAAEVAASTIANLQLHPEPLHPGVHTCTHPDLVQLPNARASVRVQPSSRRAHYLVEVNVQWRAPRRAQHRMQLKGLISSVVTPSSNSSQQ